MAEEEDDLLCVTPTVNPYLICYPELSLGHSLWLQVPSSWTFATPQNADTSQIRKRHLGSGTQSDCNPRREGNEKDICIIETLQDSRVCVEGKMGESPEKSHLLFPACSPPPNMPLVAVTQTPALAH